MTICVIALMVAIAVLVFDMMSLRNLKETFRLVTGHEYDEQCFVKEGYATPCRCWRCEYPEV